MTSRIRAAAMVIDASECSIVVACGHCGATFGPFRNADAARLAAVDHWDAWHRPVDDTGTTCRAHGCDRDSRRLGLCSMHYQRQRRNGDPSTARRYRKRQVA